MNDSNARPQAEVAPYQPSFSHSDSCDRYYTDDEDTETACTCGATKAQAWLDALVAERERSEAAARTILAEHWQTTDVWGGVRRPVCGRCTYGDGVPYLWPCPTRQALTGEPSAEPNYRPIMCGNGDIREVLAESPWPER